MTIKELVPGTQAVISDVRKVDPLTQRRMANLGMTEGEQVCLMRRLPFGGPCLCKVAGQCIGLRRSDAEKIDVSYLESDRQTVV